MAYCAITSSSGSSSYYAGVIQELKNKKSNYVKLQKDLVDIDSKLTLVYNTYFFSAMDNLIKGYDCGGKTIKHDEVYSINLRLESNKSIIERIKSDVDAKIKEIDSNISTYTIYYNNALNYERNQNNSLSIN